MENITVTQESPARRAAVAGLAVVGFFALVFIGMVLAIYAARFVPKTASGLSAAAAYLSSVFTPAGTPALTAVPNGSIPFPAATTTASTTDTASSTAATTTAQTTKPITGGTTAGQQTTSARPIDAVGGSGYAGPLTGLPNLVGTITGVGYLDNNNNFVPASTILNSQRLAVKFTVTNAGTNVSGPWNFYVNLPTKANSQYRYASTQQQSLNPGDHIDFVLHLDATQANIGHGVVTLTVDPNNQVVESSEANTVSQDVMVSSNN
jgi:hypothetical protein